MKRLILVGIFILAVPASAQKVLLIPDDDAPGSTTLATALGAAGLTVTQGLAPSWQYNGTNPAPSGFDVIVLLAGTASAAANDMPVAGQTAIANFVAAGGGFVDTEWSALQVASGRWVTLKPLVLLSRTSGTTGSLDYTVAQGFAGHPLWAGLPNSFNFPSATNVGAMIPGPGVVRVATSQLAGDAVVARDLLNSGRVVQLSTAGNFSPQTFTDANLQKLVVNACKWASASRVNFAPTANAGGPYTVNEGASIKLSGACADPDMDTQTLSWDYSHNGAFLAADATGLTPTFSAAAIAGPKTLTIALKCTDSGGLSDVKTATVNIANVAPIFGSMPPTMATEGVSYTYQAAVTDPGLGDVVTCSLSTGPAGMTVTGNGCKVSWLPSYAQAIAGTALVTLRATDGPGATTDQKWTIQVAYINSCNNGLPDTWQLLYFGKVCVSPGDDPDLDGRTNLKEFQDGTDPTKYDGPSAPTLSSPAKDAHVPLRPALVVGNAIEPNGEALSYDFEVYSDKQLTKLADVAILLPSGMGTTTYTVQMSLVEDQRYWWRSRAHDPYIAGAWSLTGTFFVDAVHEAPTAPAISMPADQAHIPGNLPSLVVTDARSSDLLALSYTFELYSDANLTLKVEGQALIPETPGSTSYQVIGKLADYTRYYWRARATDALKLDGPWSPVATFLIVPGNPPPSDPKVAFPVDGSKVVTLSPTVKVGGSVDPDDEKLTYQCDLDVKDTFDSPAKQSATALAPDGMNNATWMPSVLTEDQRYCLRCRGRDNSGTSNWVQSCFFVDVRNDPPSVPTLTNPSMGGMAAGGIVHFTWVNSIDPEGDDLRYEIELGRDEKLASRAGQVTGEDGRVGADLVGVASGRYWWRARAVDVKGAASAYSAANQFTVGELKSPSQNAALGPGGCGCHLGAARRSPAPLGALALGALCVVFARRRRRR